MRITDLLKKEGISLNTKVSSKDEAINKLVDLMEHFLSKKTFTLNK